MGAQASNAMLKGEPAAAAPMPSPEKKRPISDYFTSYKRAATFATTSNVPQKRSSPPPGNETQRTVLRETQPSVPKTPSKHRIHKPLATPHRSAQSPATPRSGTLPFRSPRPTNSSHSTPGSVRQALRRLEDQIQQELEAERTSQKKQTILKFDDVPKTYQSVVKGGKVVVVRDSDEDDSSSLASLDELLGLKTRDGDDTELSSPPDLDEDSREKERIKTLSLFTQHKPQHRPGFQRLRSVYAQEKAHKFDISKLLNDHFDAEEHEESVQKSRDRYESSKAELESKRNAELHKDLLGSLITGAGGDEDDMARVMGAVSRTEALSAEQSFSFFGPSGMTDWDEQEQPKNEFPDDAIPLKLWDPGDVDARSRSYLSGHTSELAARRKLNDSLLRWTFEATITESDDYLRSAYAECLKCGSPFWTRTGLCAETVQQCFLTLGAYEDNVKPGRDIRPSHQPIKKSETTPSHKYVLSVLDLFQTLCHHMDFLALGKLASIVCRLAVDADLMGYGSVCSQVEKLLAALLDLPPKEARVYIAEHILGDLGKTLHDPVLQSRVLAHLMPTSETAAHLRLKLAQSFLLGYDHVLASSSENFLVSLARLTEHVSTSPDFDTRRHTKVDYSALRARTHVLDAAISDGSTRTFFSNTFSEAFFNKSIDSLADAVKQTFICISDAGASHMSRTEAKDALKAVYYRLQFAVRTEPQPKKNIFDSESGRMRDGVEYRQEGRTKEFMKGFLDKARRTTKEKEEEETPPLASQPSERSESEVLIRAQLGMS